MPSLSNGTESPLFVALRIVRVWISDSMWIDLVILGGLYHHTHFIVILSYTDVNN